MAADRCSLAIAAALLAVACVPMAQAAAAPQHAHGKVQLSLLEFLGRSDPTRDARKSDGGRWMIYLSQLKLGKSASTARKPAKGKSRAGAAHETPKVRG